MTTVNSFKSRVQSLDIGLVAYQSVDETKDLITGIQRQQMFHGLNAKGEKIGRYRNSKYARVKNEMNPLPGVGIPDLKVTGAFYGGFKTVVTPQVFITTSSDGKNAELTEKYDPFGLNMESKSEYSKELKPIFVKNVKQGIGL